MGPMSIERNDHIENLIAELITLHSSSKKVLVKFIIDTYREDGRKSGYLTEFATWLLEHAWFGSLAYKVLKIFLYI